MSPQEEDPLSDLLSGVVLPPVDPLRREAIFAQTRGVLRRRRIVRRGMQIAALAACYIVGVLSVPGWQTFHRRGELVNRPGAAVDHSNVTFSVTELNRQSGPLQTYSAGETPTEIADPKSVDALTTFEKLRRAGDRQLNGRGNLQGAIGCYRRALDFASDDDLIIVPERDSWLLISLKETQIEARKHGHKKS